MQIPSLQVRSEDNHWNSPFPTWQSADHALNSKDLEDFQIKQAGKMKSGVLILADPNQQTPE